MLVSALMSRRRQTMGLALLLALGASITGGQAEPPFARYRVEQVIRLESTSARPQPVPGGVLAEPVTTAAEGRVRFILEQRRGDSTPGHAIWRFAQVEVEAPHSEPPEANNAEVERALALGLNWIQRVEGEEFTGPMTELPVVPLGEAPPAWLGAWLRWAQTGSFSGVAQNPVALPAPSDGGPTEVAYEVRWLRSEYRQVPCHVQQARWAVPVQEAAGAVPAQLAAEGVEARTHFSALSLEWISQEQPSLIYAERSGVRETFWDLKKVRKPELRRLVFRLRLAVQVRVERLP